MSTRHHEHHCPNCNHSPSSVDALQARLASIDAADDEGDSALVAWDDYIDAVCRTVAEVANLDQHAVSAILEGIIMLDGAARAKGFAAWATRDPSQSRTLRLVKQTTN